MKNKNLLEQLFTQIGDMIKLIQDRSIVDEIPPEVIARLDRLEKMVDLVEELNTRTFQTAQINPQQLLVETQNSNQIKEKDKKVLKRAQQIERDARALQLQFSLIVNKNKEKPSQDKGKQYKNKDRKKKFKPLGGNRGWIPM